MSVRLCWAGVIISLAVAAASVMYSRWSTAGYGEMRVVTERVAGAVARADREALAAEPLLRARGDNAAWYMEYSSALARGYRVSVSRNGAGGYTLMSRDIVTHLGAIETPSGTLTLGFRYDRRTERLEFVTASFSTFPTGHDTTPALSTGRD